jgi:hypothetical protein
MPNPTLVECLVTLPTNTPGYRKRCRCVHIAMKVMLVTGRRLVRATLAECLEDAGL